MPLAFRTVELFFPGRKRENLFGKNVNAIILQRIMNKITFSLQFLKPTLQGECLLIHFLNLRNSTQSVHVRSCKKISELSAI